VSRVRIVVESGSLKWVEYRCHKSCWVWFFINCSNPNPNLPKFTLTPGNLVWKIILNINHTLLIWVTRLYFFSYYLYVTSHVEYTQLITWSVLPVNMVILWKFYIILYNKELWNAQSCFIFLYSINKFRIIWFVT